MLGECLGKMEWLSWFGFSGDLKFLTFLKGLLGVICFFLLSFFKQIQVERL